MPYTLFPTEFGVCGIAWNDTGLSSFLLPSSSEKETERLLRKNSGTETQTEPPLWVAASITEARKHLAGEPQTFAKARLDWSLVTDFQRRVYEVSAKIPSGETRTYGQIAQALGLKPGASRAIGGALGANPWPLLIPCHRIVGANGKLTGFSASGGIKTKARLLQLEDCSFFKQS